MNNIKYSIIVVDDKQKYWVDDYEDLSTKAKSVRYDFENKQQLQQGLDDIPYDEGYWIFLIDENNNTLISGTFDDVVYEYVEEEIS